MNNTFFGPFKDTLKDYCDYKIKLGYSYKKEIEKLRLFDKYTNDLNCNNLTLQLIYDYINSKKDISPNTKASYASTLRGYIKYLYNNKQCNFLIPERIYKGRRKNIPHIFTDKEIKAFFNTLKSFYPNDKLKNTIFNICFELLYCTGMRCGECLNIKLNDIDFHNNSITLYNTKNKEDRRIIINDSLTNKLLDFTNDYKEEINMNEEKYLFIRHNGKKYNRCNLYDVFRKVLYYAKIEHTKDGPRVHDFRHTYCVNSYKKIIRNGGNYYNHVIALSAYVGHKNFISTEYYLRLTSELYPEIRNIAEDYTGYLIKEMDDIDE